MRQHAGGHRSARRWLPWLGLGVLVGAAAVILPLVVPVPRPEGLVDAEDLADDDSRFIDIEGVHLHYKVQGDPHAATTLVFLHGFASSVYSWRHAMAALCNHYRVIAFDRPGFGLSGRPLEGDWNGESPYSMRSSATQTLALMDALGVKSAVLVGHSQGASIAVLVADAAPERVEALVLVSAPTASRRFRGRPYLDKLRTLPQLARIAPLVPRPFFGRNARAVMAMAYANPKRLTDETVELELKAVHVKDWDLSYVELTKHQGGFRFPEAMARVSVPTLVIAGRRDRTVPYRSQVRVARSIPGARLLTFYDTGHVPPEERPGAFDEVLGDFVEEVEA